MENYLIRYDGQTLDDILNYIYFLWSVWYFEIISVTVVYTSINIRLFLLQEAIREKEGE